VKQHLEHAPARILVPGYTKGTIRTPSGEPRMTRNFRVIFVIQNHGLPALQNHIRHFCARPNQPSFSDTVIKSFYRFVYEHQKN
jgi:hypothetical protein